MTVVGYGVENGKGFYKVLNSWGRQWGENGYFRIYEDLSNANTCGITAIGFIQPTGFAEL